MRRMQNFRRRRRHAQAMSDIPLTPLIDTALTLLVIFMIATPMIQNSIRVTLPHGSAKEDKGERQELVIYIDKDNKLFFNGTNFNAKQLIEALKGRIGEQKDKSVFVKADQGALCGQVFELVDTIKVIGGVQSVIFSTQQKRA